MLSKLPIDKRGSVPRLLFGSGRAVRCTLCTRPSARRVDAASHSERFHRLQLSRAELRDVLSRIGCALLRPFAYSTVASRRFVTEFAFVGYRLIAFGTTGRRRTEMSGNSTSCFCMLDSDLNCGWWRC